GLRHLSENGSGGRVVDRKGLARGRRDQLPVDQQAARLVEKFLDRLPQPIVDSDGIHGVLLLICCLLRRLPRHHERAAMSSAEAASRLGWLPLRNRFAPLPPDGGRLASSAALYRSEHNAKMSSQFGHALTCAGNALPSRYRYVLLDMTKMGTS